MKKHPANCVCSNCLKIRMTKNRTEASGLIHNLIENLSRIIATKKKTAMGPGQRIIKVSVSQNELDDMAIRMAKYKAILKYC